MTKTKSIIFPPDLSRPKKILFSTLIKNQKEYLDQASEDIQALLKTHFGSDYRAKILDGFSQAIFNSNIWDMIGTQTMAGPTSKVFYFAQPGYVAIDSKEISAITRRFRTRLSSDIEGSFAEVLQELLQELVGDLFLVAKGKGGIDPVTTFENNLLETIKKQAGAIYSSTGQGLANRLVCHSKYKDLLAGLLEKFTMFFDDKFPEDEILIFHYGTSCLKHSYIFSPYVFQFHRMGFDSSSKICIVSRYAKRLLYSNGMALVQIEN